jgi:hypothetical protein
MMSLRHAVCPVAGPEGGVGAMNEGGYLLELFGSDLVTHPQSAWNRGSILPPAVDVHAVF